MRKHGEMVTKTVTIEPLTPSIHTTIDRLREQIAVRAYHIGAQRGGEPGHELDDWVAAENELVWKPDLRLEETAHSLRVKFRLPEVRPPDLRLYLDRHTLVLLGEVRPEEPDEDVRVHGSEFRYGQIYRHVLLPVAIEPEKAAARLKDGVLTITLAKPAAHARGKPGRRFVRRKEKHASPDESS